jgi:hypothetical protein
MDLGTGLVVELNMSANHGFVKRASFSQDGLSKSQT